jgi:cellulose synthase/poly-beta-1,6-N-acetylglucosamine synthase-like glycosyltransferase
MWQTLLFSGLTAFFLATTLAVCFHLHWVRRLPPLNKLEPTVEVRHTRDVPSRCSIVVAARDEELRIAGTVRHLLSQKGVEIELIVVDDRSTDRTSNILTQLATEDPRVQSVRVDSLPAGWLGKCHACHVAAQAAQHDWILFTDADCWLQPDVLRRALLVAARDEADHVTLTPGVAAETVSAQGWHLAFLLSAANWISAVNRDRPGAHLGVGAFNLVRRSAYLECGGHEALRMTVVDDVKLGLLLSRAKKRTRAFIGGEDAECHWGTTVPNMIKIMEKNYFAVIDYRLSLVITLVLAALVIGGVMAWGPFTRTIVGWLPGLAWMTLALPAALLARRLRWPLYTAVAAPLLMPLLIYAMANSAWVTLRQGGISWRGTFYPLQELRDGNVQ